MTQHTSPRRALTAAALSVLAVGTLAAATSGGELADALGASSTTSSAPAPTSTTPSSTPTGRFDEGSPTTSPTAPTSTPEQVLPPRAPTAPPRLAPRGGSIPVGKGMWIWMPERADGGDPAGIVARAKAAGLTHIYVRTGSSRRGFEAAAFLEALLPVAHDAGLRVYGWDFPYLEDVGGDVNRALIAINFRTTTGHRIDGFVPDIETGSEGTNLSAETAGSYSQLLRGAVGEDYPLIACVPHPSPQRQASFPYGAILPHYDAVAPMSYWLNRQPDSDAHHAVSWLTQFGKPVIPVGQAYDGAAEGGRPGPPPADESRRFVSAAEAAGAVGASFWSWQHATQEIWDAIAAAPELAIPMEHVSLDREQLLMLQAELSSMSYWAPPTGVWDDQTIRAVTAFQIEMGLLPTGALDVVTRTTLLGPLAPPVGR